MDRNSAREEVTVSSLPERLRQADRVKERGPDGGPGASQADPCAELHAEVRRLSALINTPELHDFARGVVLEAAHQRERFGSTTDTGKSPADWFWLVGHLASKALLAQTSGNTEKALHHTISTAAALANWHGAISGTNAAMRPGIGADQAKGIE